MIQGNLPVIPEEITVHLGAPGSNAQNVTVPFTDYIKNVASSEIYPTWPEAAIRANILAQITFALNRIYTEYYRSQGYDFDITNSTAYDQSFVFGRDIFENISQIVDEIFNTYIARQGNIEPIYAQYCDGIEVQCEGLSQWGSAELAESGYIPYDILKYYYGDNIDLVSNVAVAPVNESYPGIALALGSSGNDVRELQVKLNRISKNYPQIPKITTANGIFTEETENAVKTFQQIFDLTPDGVVGRATWYKIQRIFIAVKRLSDLYSEGLTLDEVADIFRNVLSEGDRGYEVEQLQYLIDFISNFEPTVNSLNIDGIFGPRTKQEVENIQKLYGLPVTGTVDFVTWERIARAYRAMLNSVPEGYFPERLVPYPGYPLTLGSRGETVTALQTYLNKISDVYTEIPKIPTDGWFGPQTFNAVSAYQKLFGDYVSGIVGGPTWSSIVNTYSTINDGMLGSPGQYGGEIT